MTTTAPDLLVAAAVRNNKDKKSKNWLRAADARRHKNKTDSDSQSDAKISDDMKIDETEQSELSHPPAKRARIVKPTSNVATITKLPTFALNA